MDGGLGHTAVRKLLLPSLGRDGGTKIRNPQLAGRRGGVQAGIKGIGKLAYSFNPYTPSLPPGMD